MPFRVALNAHICNSSVACRLDLPRVFLIVLCSISVLAFSPETYGHCTSSHPGHCVSEPIADIGKAVDNVKKVPGNILEKVAQNFGNTNEKVVQDKGQAPEPGTSATGKTVEKAEQDADKTLEKTAKDAEPESVSEYENLVDAFEVAGEFLERQIHGDSDSDYDAEKRIREGKVIGAFWHLGADNFKYSQDNAAKATQERALINTIEQVSTSLYGGPAGVAANAAWYTYRVTGDFEMALRIGVKVGAKKAANAAVQTLPAEQLALISGAIGGIAVAASGGDENAVVEGFLKSGGMVLVQDGYKEYTENDLDTRNPIGDTYCMLAIPKVSVDPSQSDSCLPPVSSYTRDVNGNVLDEDGNLWSSKSGKSPDMSVRNSDYRRDNFGNWSESKDFKWIYERGSFMATVSNVPGMNAIAEFHDHWAVSWNMSALNNKVTIVPAVVLTYMGTTAPLEKLIIDENKNSQHEQNAYESITPDNTVLDVSNSVAVKRQLKIPDIYGVIGSGGVRVAEHSCESAGLVRNIVVDKGSESTDYACRVVYESEKGVSVPWRARNDPDFCGPKAALLLSNLLEWGWTCVSRELPVEAGPTVRRNLTNPFVPKVTTSDVPKVTTPDVPKVTTPDVPKNKIPDQARSTSGVYKCFHGNFIRTIYVELGNSNDAFACRVVYKSEGNTTIPWTAEKDWKYCSPIAVALASKFEDYGWNCR